VAALAQLTDGAPAYNVGDAAGKVIGAFGIPLGIIVIVVVAHPTARRAYR